MIKTAKVEQMKWKEERLLAQPPPPPLFQEEMDLRGIKTKVAGNIAFRGRFQSWLQDEYRYSNRAPPQRWMDRSCKGENCSTCAKCPRCRFGLCMEGRWEKDFANAFIVTNAWPVEMIRIGKYFKLTRKQVKISLVRLKSKASSMCEVRETRQGEWWQVHG